MTIWVMGTYVLFLASILAGLIVCAASSLPRSHKIFWAGVIVVFPIGGTVLFLLIKNESQDLLS